VTLNLHQEKAGTRKRSLTASTRLADQGRFLWYLYHVSPTARHRALAMSSNDPLRRLFRLDRSSSKFHDQVSNILYGEEYRQWVLNLRSEDLVGLVDYLDKVLHRASPLRSPPPAQAKIGARCSRSCQYRFPEVSARAQRHLWRQNDTTTIVHA